MDTHIMFLVQIDQDIFVCGIEMHFFPCLFLSLFKKKWIPIIAVKKQKQKNSWGTYFKFP